MPGHVTQEGCDARGIVLSVMVPDTVVLVRDATGIEPVADIVMLFVPSALWATLVVADIATELEFCVITRFALEPSVFVPFIVMLPLHAPEVVYPEFVLEYFNVTVTSEYTNNARITCRSVYSST